MVPCPAVCASEGRGHLGRHLTEAVALLQGTGSCRICQSPTRSTIEYDVAPRIGTACTACAVGPVKNK